MTRSTLLGAALLALAIAPLTAQQSSREVVMIGGGAGTQDIRIATEQAVAGLAGSRLPAMPLGQGVIVGQIVDGGSKQPIAGAIVTMSLPAAQPIRALADSEGRFAFRDLPKGRFNLTATKAGYVEGAHGRLRPSGPSVPLELNDGDKDATISIPLWRYAAITGTIVDENGDPMVATSVRAMRRSTVAGQPKLTMASTDLTDDRGVFRITMLEPGDYVIAVPMTQNSGLAGEVFSLGGGAEFVAEVAARGEPMILNMAGGNASAGTAPDGSPLAYQTQFYPATTASPRATVLTVGSGEERAGIDFQLKPIRTHKVAGRVMAPDGPSVHTQLSLVPADAEGLASPIETATTMTDNNGEFSFPAVPSGAYAIKVVRSPAPGMRGVPEEVTVTSGGGGSMMVMTRAVAVAGVGGAVPPPPSDPTLWADLPVTVGSTDLTDVMVSLRAGARVRGQVQFNGTAEKPTPDRLPNISVTLEAADGRPAAMAPFLRGRVENTGQFSTVSVPAGRYFLRVGGVPQGWSFRGAMLGGRDLADTAIDIEGADVGGVTLVFTDKMSEISGSVTSPNGNADGAATVLVFPADRDGWTNYGTSPRRLRNVRADRNGAFSIGNLPPGEYLVAAVREASAGDWQNPKFLEALVPEARRVQLSEGQKMSQSLRVVR